MNFRRIIKSGSGCHGQHMFRTGINHAARSRVSRRRAAVRGGAIECALLFRRCNTQRQTSLSMSDRRFGQPGLAIGRRQEALRAQVVEHIPGLEPMKARAMCGVDHPFGTFRRTIRRLSHFPSEVVQFDREPPVGASDIERRCCHGGPITDDVLWRATRRADYRQMKREYDRDAGPSTATAGYATVRECRRWRRSTSMPTMTGAKTNHRMQIHATSGATNHQPTLAAQAT
jgi:hypothetical protein